MRKKIRILLHNVDESSDDDSARESVSDDMTDLIPKPGGREKSTTTPKSSDCVLRPTSTSKQPPGMEDDATPSVSVLASEGPTATEDDIPPHDVPAVYVLAVSKRPDGKRKYDKKQYCQFCQTLVHKYALHLERHHGKEVDVAKALSFNKKTKERRRHLELLRNNGNFLHNASVLKTGEGCLIARKRPSKDAIGKGFVHCKDCLVLVRRKLLWKHAEKCKRKNIKRMIAKF